MVDPTRLSCWVFVYGIADDAEAYAGPFVSGSQAYEWADSVGVKGYAVPVVDPFSDRDRLTESIAW